MPCLYNPRMHPDAFPPFRPHPLLRNGHLQTLSLFLARRRDNPFTKTVQHRVPVSHEDNVVLHDDRPAAWRQGDPTVLMLHGLGGSHRSLYITRIAGKLFHRGVRTFRLDMRMCGAAAGLAHRSYHAGLTGDALAAIARIAAKASSSPLTAIGFSLGGNLLLKMLADHRHDLQGRLRRAIAVCPPLDLAGSVRSLQVGARRFYDRHFVRLLMRQLARNAERRGEPCPLERIPESLYDFDERYTARIWGFASAEDYYTRSSCGPGLVKIECPTIILAAADDPMIPRRQYEATPRSLAVDMSLPPSGGHLGFIAARNSDPDRHWMDWRILEWVAD